MNKTYTNDFKVNILRFADFNGVKKASKKFKVSESSIYKWRREFGNNRFKRDDILRLYEPTEINLVRKRDEIYSQMHKLEDKLNQQYSLGLSSFQVDKIKKELKDLEENAKYLNRSYEILIAERSHLV